MTDMDYTSGMVSLLGAVRKEMNGAVLDTMRYYGADYGLNYGVAIHTLREIAGRMPRNDGFARYLYLQQVRELRIIALWLAEPERLTPADFAFWGGGIINSEVAEQAAHALFSRSECVEELLAEWCDKEALLAYSALMAASRAPHVGREAAVNAIVAAVGKNPDNHIAAQGAIALAVSVRVDAGTLRDALGENAGCPTASTLLEEVAWRADY